MQRVGQLLEALMESHRKGAGREELLGLVQELQAELSGRTMAVPPVQSSGTGKVSVIMPFLVASAPPVQVEEEKIVQVLQIDERELEAELEELRRSAELKNELSTKVRQAKVEWDDPLDEIPTLASHRDYLPKPQTPVTPQPIVHPVQASEPAPAPAPAPSPQEPVEQKKPAPPASLPAGRDLNEVIGKQEASLNERLKTVQSELSEKLQDAPLRDLRKAIGINDRYLYINELFNGNEAMYDRSLKTLNGFAAFSEAEFWMQRELRLKLGWKEDHVLVQQFLQLVRRRFS